MYKHRYVHNKYQSFSAYIGVFNC